jgi:hypothetical protein
MRKPLTLSVSETHYIVIHEISQGVRYKPAKSESYSPIRWFLRSEDGHPSCKASPDIIRCLRSLHPNIHDASMQVIEHLLAALCTTLRLARTRSMVIHTLESSQ